MAHKKLNNFAISGFSDDEEGVDVLRNPSDEDSCKLLAAAENGDLDTIRELLERNAELVNVCDAEGYTPLHRACYGNHVPAIKLLLQNGANIAAKTELEWEPLHSCCRWDNVEAATVLIAEGADVNAMSEGGQTPLHIAASNGSCFDMVQLLLLHPSIKPELKNCSGDLAIDIARRSSKLRNVFEMVDPILTAENIELL